MVEVPRTEALIHSPLGKVAGAILYIALAPSKFCIGAVTFQARNVTQPLQGHFKPLQSLRENRR